MSKKRLGSVKNANEWILSQVKGGSDASSPIDAPAPGGDGGLVNLPGGGG